MSRLALLLALGSASAFAQSPNGPPPANPPAPMPSAVVLASTSSRISHVVFGQDGRVQGLLLHNGTFVTLSASLAQQVPTTLRHHTLLSVSGPAFNNGTDRTIQAQQLTLNGIAYRDDGGPGGEPGGLAPQPVRGALVPPPPAGGPSLASPPQGSPGVAPPPAQQGGPGVAPPLLGAARLVAPPPTASGPAPALPRPTRTTH